MSIKGDLSVAVVMGSAFMSRRFSAMVMLPGVVGGVSYIVKCLIISVFIANNLKVLSRFLRS